MCKKMPIFKTLQTLQGEIIIRLVELVKPNCVEVVVFSHCTVHNLFVQLQIRNKRLL
jgi:16S rRNA C967 or C1407 C5-methylase (RsmB/RsmF family)